MRHTPASGRTGRARRRGGGHAPIMPLTSTIRRAGNANLAGCGPIPVRHGHPCGRARFMPARRRCRAGIRRAPIRTDGRTSIPRPQAALRKTGEGCRPQVPVPRCGFAARSAGRSADPRVPQASRHGPRRPLGPRRGRASAVPYPPVSAPRARRHRRV